MLLKDFRDMLSALSEAKAEYLVVGAHALANHGLVRATGDLDCWINPTPENAQRVFRALEVFGASNWISMDDLMHPNRIIQIGIVPVRIDLMTSIDGVSFAEAWAARVLTEVNGLQLPVLSREHLLINKRATGRPQDRVDAERLEALGEPPK
jgi:hypothetical protein